MQPTGVMDELCRSSTVPNATCPTCGSGDLPKAATGPRATYCSRKCRSHAQYLRAKESGSRGSRRDASPKVCAECGAAFIPLKTAKQRFCTKRCSIRHGNRKWRAGRGACAIEGCVNLAVSRGLCKRHHPEAEQWSRGKPETRQANLRRKTQQRRARTKGDSAAELIDRGEIGNRDGWRCGICRRAINRDLPYPNPRSASLDHIVPLSLGGKHAKENVQIAHLGCNVAKSNRASDVQVLLIG